MNKEKSWWRKLIYELDQIRKSRQIEENALWKRSWWSRVWKAKWTRDASATKDSLLVSAFLEQQLMQDSQHEHYVSEEDESGEEDCPVIKLSMEEKKHIRAPWRQTIIVKVMGWWVGYAYLLRRLQSLWKIHGNLGLMDLGNDFFLAKFSNSDDRDFALF